MESFFYLRALGVIFTTAFQIWQAVIWQDVHSLTLFTPELLRQFEKEGISKNKNKTKKRTYLKEKKNSISWSSRVAGLSNLAVSFPDALQPNNVIRLHHRGGLGLVRR
jgi:hypothetical protein